VSISVVAAVGVSDPHPITKNNNSEMLVSSPIVSEKTNLLIRTKIRIFRQNFSDSIVLKISYGIIF